MHSTIMLTGTAGLLIVGTLGFLVLEWRGTLWGFALGQRLLVSFVHSVTARTAGFNTKEQPGLSDQRIAKNDKYELKLPYA